MFIVWGSGGNRISCGSVESHCDICQKETFFRLIYEYKYWGIYWVFNVITEQHYSAHCTICGRSWELMRHEVELLRDEVPDLKNLPIPMNHQYGCLISIIIFVLLAILGSIFGGG